MNFRALRPLVARLVSAAILAVAISHVASAATFTVTSTNDSGVGSLRWAITNANATVGTNTIAFNIPGNGVKIISPATQYATIANPVVIDGYTQPGSAPNTLPNGNN